MFMYLFIPTLVSLHLTKMDLRNDFKIEYIHGKIAILNSPLTYGCEMQLFNYISFVENDP